MPIMDYSLLCKETMNIDSVRGRLALVRKNNVTTAEKNVLIAQQEHIIRRANIKREKLLEVKAKSAKRKREEKFKQVKKRLKLKEEECKEKFKQIKSKEGRSKELRIDKKPPKTPNCQVFKTPTSTVVDYCFANLSEDNSTDDEDSPRKVIPKWAHMENLRPALIKQHQDTKSGKYSDFTSIFRKIREFKFEDIFKE